MFLADKISSSIVITSADQVQRVAGWRGAGETAGCDRTATSPGCEARLGPDLADRLFVRALAAVTYIGTPRSVRLVSAGPVILFSPPGSLLAALVRQVTFIE